MTDRTIKGMDAETIRRYAEARKKIDPSTDLICCLSSIFSTFEDWSDDRVELSAFAVGKLNDMMNLHACRILEALEDFLPAAQAKDAVERLGDGSE